MLTGATLVAALRDLARPAVTQTRECDVGDERAALGRQADGAGDAFEGAVLALADSSR